MEQRVRYVKGAHVERTNKPEFLNPYPWMSDIDAMVHLELERRRIPFSYRYFDGNSPTLKFLIPDYAPEFTLTEYKIVILVIGDFFGTIPSVLDRTALAKVALEQDGWKVDILLDHDIRANVGEALNRAVPELIHPTFLGPVKPNPFGVATTLKTRRIFLSGLALLKTHFQPKKVIGHVDRVRHFIHRVAVDSGRVRHPRDRGKPSGA